MHIFTQDLVLHNLNGWYDISYYQASNYFTYNADYLNCQNPR